LLSSSNARLAAARRLTRRSARRSAGRFLAEGPQAVREALAAGAVLEMFATPDAARRHPALAAAASIVSPHDAAALSETVTPQGLVAVCPIALTPLGEVLARRPRLLVVLVDPGEPGNVGAIVRTADAAGADAIVLAGGTDPFNGKAVRASAGSLFHLPIAAESPTDLITQLRSAGLRVLATTGSGATSLHDLEEGGTLGSEAHGLPPDLIAAADRAVRVPSYGRAESLNLAAAAAVCLYASARARRATDNRAE
jgi:TrmH family RNA methyltransferase